MTGAPLEGRRLSAAWRRYWPMVLLIGLLWVVRYWHSGAFGLYEDDFSHLPTAAAMTFPQAVAYAFDLSRIGHLLGQGHPLHYTFIYLFANVGWRIGDLQGPYWIGFTIEALNVGLFFLLLRRIANWRLALVSGMAYVLYSADTTQAYLTYALGIHPSITFFLLAGHAYVSKKKWLAYLLTPLMLLTYETLFPVFFALPLLDWVKGKRRWWDLIAHTVVMGGILAFFAGWRFAVGDNRIGGLDVTGALITPLVHMGEGPIVALGTYLYRAVQTIQSMDVEVLVVTVVGAAVFAAIFSRRTMGWVQSPQRSLRQLVTDPLKESNGWRRIPHVYAQLPYELTRLVRAAVAGAAMLLMAYPLTFTVRAYAITGRDTRVHAAGVLGAAVLVGSLILIALWLADAVGRRRSVNVLLAAWLGLLAGYGFVIQRDYRLAWVYQQQFWTSLVQMIPDVSEGDSILVDPQGLQDTRQIAANYWNLPYVLDQIYQFPEDWKTPVWTYRLTDSWEQHIVGNGGELVLNAATVFAPMDTFRDIDPSSAILIETDLGQLTRRYEPMDLGGETVAFKRAEDGGEPAYPHGFLYRYLVVSSDTAPR